jgi:hypothetical protein
MGIRALIANREQYVAGLDAAGRGNAKVPLRDLYDVRRTWSRVAVPTAGNHNHDDRAQGEADAPKRRKRHFIKIGL